MNMEIQFFLDTEKKYNLLSRQLNDIPYWEISRFLIWQYQICSAGLNLGQIQSEKKLNFTEIIMKFFVCSLKRMKLHKLKPSEIIIVNHSRHEWLESGYDCIYSSELSNYYSSTVLDQNTDRGHRGNNSEEKQIVPCDAIYFFSYGYYVIHKYLNSKKYRQYRNNVEIDLTDPLKELCDHYNVELDFANVFDLILLNIFNYEYQSKIIKKIINKVTPKVIIEVVHYHVFCMAMNKIARDQKIPTIELQHGTMHEDHAAYQYGTEKLIPQLPEYCFTFSDYWNRIAHMPADSTKLIATGFPYFEKQIYNARARNIRLDKRRTILFLSQITIGEKLSKLAVELGQKLDSQKWRLVYKLHPGEFAKWEMIYPWLKNSDIEVGSSSEMSVYDWFAVSDIQVGVYSTAIYEGFGFGLATYIYDIGHANTMKNLADAGYVVMFDSVDKLLELIETDSKESKDIQAFWKLNAMDNILNEINTIYQKK